MGSHFLKICRCWFGFTFFRQDVRSLVTWFLAMALWCLIMTIWSLACTIHVLGYDLCPWGTQISKHGIFVVLSYQKISIPLINKHNVCHVWHHGCSPWPCCFWPQPYGLWSHCPWHSPNCVPMSWKWRRTIALLVACKWAQHRQLPTFYIYIFYHIILAMVLCWLATTMWSFGRMVLGIHQIGIPYVLTNMFFLDIGFFFLSCFDILDTIWCSPLGWARTYNNMMRYLLSNHSTNAPTKAYETKKVVYIWVIC